MKTGQPEDAAPAVYTSDTEAAPQVTTAEDESNAGDVLDVIPASDEGLSGGNEVRGPVTGPTGKAIPPEPPAPKEPHLVYSQQSGDLTDPEGRHVANGYAGKNQGKNNPDAEGEKGVGPIPRGNWRIEEARDKPWPEPAYKLTPDDDTRKRAEALDRDPGSFYVHAKSRHIEEQGRGDSQGCIALDKVGREKLKSRIGSWIRVEK
jgi:hypothetical protein